ncbi:ATP-dependent DNA helicase [Heracleum sosnowskyi]|uniref:ATP-dependent DNA helicase n=1 Tax=Heracleum sosnowskyi TaxID=360622 RepID=A0AAD8GN82_9APIA|nr:ATP-dependent DNA helicase [Heracleum sosnowskyi]
MWKEERVNKNSKHGKPIFSLCCRKGQINLPKAPPTPSYLWQLYNDSKKGPLFRKCSRMYNSMFSFTSTGGNIDHSVNNGCGPYVYRLNGQNHHVFGSLIPNDGETPKFCQLYIYDTENEVSNRMQWMDIDDNDKINSEIVEGLMKMLDYTNELVKEFRVARDRFKDSPFVDLKIVLKVCRSQSGRENNIGLSNEVAAIMVGGVEDPSASRDIILEHENKGKKRQKCTMMEFYSYKFQVRSNEGMTPRLDNPDIVARVFRLKLDQLLDDIKKNSYFGVCIGVMYVVEFQKRGLPHVHMLIWLDSTSKKNLMGNVDQFVSAEIPDPVLDPVGYAGVKAFMIHVPCGVEYPKSPCMKDFKCTRHFPKKYCPRIMFDESGFPLYKRRNTGVTVKVRHDRATVEVRGLRKKQTPVNDDSVDEIQAFFDGRYICGSEASYRTFGFQIHHRSISVERLSFHLPGQKNCTFRSNDSLKKVAEREKNKVNKLEAFFKLNITDPNARQFTYDQIPHKYVWNDGANKWTLRKKGFQIGRLIYTHHSSGEIWYLRLLLSKVRGCTSFESLRTVNGVLYSTYHEACKELGLLENDDEWHEVLTECSKCGFPPQIRQLFVHIIVNCQVSDVCQLWLSHCQVMGDDILIMKRRSSGNNNLNLSHEEIQFYALGEINRLLRSLGKSLKDYPQIPQPPPQYLNNGVNNLILEETSYNKDEMESEFKHLLSNCNEEQMVVYNAVLHYVNSDQGGFFFVYGSGGCGKTYLWRTLICKLRASGKIVLPVASSGIAATLLPGGRTAHSRFKIPILLDDYSLCGIGHNSDSAELIRRTSLIIWDEAPMQHRYAFECLDRSLRDLMKVHDRRRFHKPFGGITVLLGGDFRQILPVIPYASRGEVVSACIASSRLWHLCSVFILRKNMRLKLAKTDAESEVLSIFAKWVLDVGDGKIQHAESDSSLSTEFDIPVPHEFCNLEESNSVENMIHCIYPNFLENFKSPKYLSERAILTLLDITF